MEEGRSKFFLNYSVLLKQLAYMTLLSLIFFEIHMLSFVSLSLSNILRTILFRAIRVGINNNYLVAKLRILGLYEGKPFTHIVCLMAWIVFSPVVLSNTPLSVSKANRAALVIGISQYSDPNMSLKRADYDAERIFAKLNESSEYKNGVKALYDSYATKSAIEEAIYSFYELNEPLDEFFLYFSGHGAQQIQSTDDFILPTDARDIATSLTTYSIANPTYITKSWLANMLSKIKARRIVVIIDACYSGTTEFGTLFAKNFAYNNSDHNIVERAFGKSPPLRNPDGIYLIQSIDDLKRELSSRSKSLVYIAAAGADQTAKEYDDNWRGGGALTSAIIDALDAKQMEVAHSQMVHISVGELYTDAHKIFYNSNKRLRQNQDPMAFPLPDSAVMSEGTFLSLPGLAAPQSIMIQYRLDTNNIPVEIRRSGKLIVSGENPAFSLNETVTNADVLIPATKYVERISLSGYPNVINALRMQMSGTVEIQTLKEVDGVVSAPGPQVVVKIDDEGLGEAASFSKAGLLVGSHKLSVEYQQNHEERTIEIRATSTMRVNVIFAVPKVKPKIDPNDLN